MVRAGVRGSTLTRRCSVPRTLVCCTLGDGEVRSRGAPAPALRVPPQPHLMPHLNTCTWHWGQARPSLRACMPASLSPLWRRASSRRAGARLTATARSLHTESGSLQWDNLSQEHMPMSPYLASLALPQSGHRSPLAGQASCSPRHPLSMPSNMVTSIPSTVAPLLIAQPVWARGLLAVSPFTSPI